MKKIFCFFVSAFVVASAFAQITSLDGTFSSGSSGTNTSLRTGTTSRLTILSSNGFIGINTASPSTYLDINGSLRIRSIPTGSTLTQILVADGSGNVNTRPIFPFVTSSSNLGLGGNALMSNSGLWNVAVGQSTLSSNTSGQSNTALGHESLLSNSTGSYNVGIGFQSLFYNLFNYNTAVGYRAGFQNTYGIITAIGYRALYSNTTGYNNNVVGYNAMYTNISGNNNAALGSSTLYFNTSGSDNVAIGESAMFYNTTGIENTACGFLSLAYANSNYNTAFGSLSQAENISGEGNTAVGYSALSNNETGYANNAFGSGSGPTSSNLHNTVAIGNSTFTTADDQVRIGNSSVTSIGGQVSWSTLSDGRFKKNIQEDVAGLSFIKRLRPVSYTVDQDAENKFLGIPDSITSKISVGRKQSVRQTGFVAQEVEKVVKETGYVFYGVDAPQNDKSHYSLRYSEFVIPLVKAVQELSVMVEDQKKEIEELKATLSEKQSVGEKSSYRIDAKLNQNKPNPFSENTNISMTLPETTHSADIMVYNLEGKQLKRIAVTARGNVNVTVGANDLPAGMYLYALIVDGKVIDTKRMILTH